MASWLHSFTSVLFPIRCDYLDAVFIEMLLGCVFNLSHPALEAFVHSVQRPAGDFSGLKRVLLQC